MSFGARFLRSPDRFPPDDEGEPWGDGEIAVELPGGPYRFVGLSAAQVEAVQRTFPGSVSDAIPNGGPLLPTAGGTVAPPLTVRLRRAAASDFLAVDTRGWDYAMDFAWEPARVRLAGLGIAGSLEWRPALAGTLWTCEDGGERFPGIFENFFRVLAAYRLLELGGAILHCAAVVKDGRAFLFLGRSGAGKTTVSRFSLAAGLDVLSDDLNVLWPVMPEDVTLAAGKPESAAPEAGMPGTPAPEARMPGAATPEARMPATAGPEAGKPETPAPEAGKLGAPAPEARMPATAGPEAGKPRPPAPEARKPGAAASEARVSGTAVTEARVPGAAASETRKLGASAPEGRMPTTAGPEAGMPEIPAPEAGKLGAAGPEARVTGAAASETRKLGASAPEGRMPTTAGPEAGMPETPAPEAGKLGAAEAEARMPATAGPEAGTPGTAALEAGNPEAAGPDAGTLGASAPEGRTPEAATPLGLAVRKLPFTGDFGDRLQPDPGVGERQPVPLAMLLRLEQSDGDALIPLSRAATLACMVACSPFVNVDPYRRERLEERLAQLLAAARPPAYALRFSLAGNLWSILA